MIMTGLSADDYESPEIYNQFLEHMIWDDYGFYFFVLRPHIIKNHED